MLTLSIIDSLSLPGSDARPNEDQMGWNAQCAFVMDGATGLGPDFIVGRNDSDAAWLATFAKVHFEEMIAPGRSMIDIVRSTNALARRIVAMAAGGRDVPAWNLPVAGFQMVRIEGRALVTYGVGDCLLIVSDANGQTEIHSAMPGNAAFERETARRAIARSGGLGERQRLIDDPELLARERSLRAKYNTAGSTIWTLGAAPEAADHLVSAQLGVAAPLTGLLMSDGFAALTENYGLCEPRDLVARARRDGLAILGARLRDIERNEDPHGLLYPRMKPSDDATAILFEIAEATGSR